MRSTMGLDGLTSGYRVLLRMSCLLVLVRSSVAAVELNLRIGMSTADSNRLPMVAVTPAAPGRVLDPITVTWELSSAIYHQQWFNLTVLKYQSNTSEKTSNPVVYSTGKIQSSNQSTALPGIREKLAAASRYLVIVEAFGEQTDGTVEHLVSNPRMFFTALSAWEGEPIWAAPCTGGTGDAPEFAWFHSFYNIPNASIESAIAFVTAESPLNIPPYGCCGEEDQGSKMLGGYKLWINGEVIGTGPGRPRCGAVAQGDCDRETPYDGFDITSELNTNDGKLLDILIQSYGQEQPSVNVTQRIQFELVIRFGNGTVTTLASSTTSFRAFDATTVYNPEGNSGGTFGSGFWYYAPHENFDARCVLPPKADVNYMTSETCGVANEQDCAIGVNNCSVSLTCPVDQEIVRIAFASYGEPEGSCSSGFTTGCSAYNSKTIVEGVCLRKQHCVVNASNKVFGDPCPNQHKRLAIKAICGPPGSECNACWGAPIAKPQFNAPLTPKPVLPMSYFRVNPSSIVKIGVGHFKFIMSSEIQGGVRLKLSSSAKFKSAAATIALSEQMNDDGSVKVPMRTGADFNDTWTLLPLAEIEHHEYMNWRYGEVQFRDRNGVPLDLASGEFSLDAWQVQYPWDKARATSFVSSSDELNRVWKFNQNSVRVLTLDLYSDSNARQRSPDCQADAAVAIQAQFATSSELGFQKMMTEQIMNFAHISMTNGKTNPWPFPPPSESPAVHRNGTGGYVSPTWADWTILPAINTVNMVKYTGDLKIGQRYLQYILAYHMYLDMIDESGLVIDHKCSASNSCLSALIDTSGGSDDGFIQSKANAVVNAWVYFGLRQVAQLARWLGNTTEATKLDSMADTLKIAFNEHFLCSNGAVCDGICVDVNHTSVHSSFYALAFGLINSSNMKSTWSYIKHRIETSSVGVPCGAYPVQFLLLALYNYEKDLGHAAFDVLTAKTKHSWLTMMDVHNATTTMECWDPDELPNLTFSHIWSASPSFIIPWFLAGIQPLLPGYSKFEVKPQLGPLSSLNVALPTVRGRIALSAKQQFSNSNDTVSTPSKFQMTVTVPGNSQATLHVPMLPNTSACIELNGVRMNGTMSLQRSHVAVDVGPGVHTVSICSINR